MKKLMLVLAAAAAISACSDVRDRRTAATDNSAQQPDLTLPDTTPLRDTSTTLSSHSRQQPVPPVEQQVSQSEKRSLKTGPAPRPRHRRTPPAPSRVDTSTRGYAPNPPADTVALADTGTIDTGQGGPADTAAARKRDTVAAAPAHDTVAVSPAETATVATPDTVAARSPDTAPTVAANPARTLPIGTEIHAALDDSITSRRDTVGQAVSAHVMENVTGSDGRTLIAAGTPVRFTISRLRASRSKDSQGRLALRADGIALNGQLQAVQAAVRPVPRELRGRGVTGSEAGKVAAGAAGGAVVGRVVGGNTRGAVIGGVAGAAAGAVVANQTATRDVVVKAKTPVVIVLTQPLTAP